MEQRNNKRWGESEINILRENIDKPVDWLSKRLGRSIGSISMMVRKLESQSGLSKTSITLPPASPAGKIIHIQNNSSSEVEVNSTSKIVLKPNESVSVNSSPKWMEQLERANRILLTEGMEQSQCDTEMSYVHSIFNDNPALKSCELDSIVSAIINVGRTNMTLNPALKLSYLKVRDGKCVFELTYRGLIKTLTDSGSIKVMDAHIVYEDDYEFEYLPAENKIHHKPRVSKTEKENNSRSIAGAYSVAILSDGTKHYHFMEIWKLLKIEDMSKGSEGDYYYNQWKTDMYKKSVIRSHFKFLPKATAMPRYVQQAIMIDEENSQLSKYVSKKKVGMMEFFSKQK